MKLNEKEDRIVKMEKEIATMINEQNDLKIQQDQLILSFEEGLKQQECLCKLQCDEILRQQEFRDEFQKYFGEHIQENNSYPEPVISIATNDIDLNSNNYDFPSSLQNNYNSICDEMNDNQ